MPRTATIRSASLAPDETRLADELAQSLAGGSFTELTRLFLQQFGEPLRRQIKALRESGIDAGERPMVMLPTHPDSADQIRDFYASSTWSDRGPVPR